MSRNGCSNGGLGPTAAGSPCASRNGQINYGPIDYQNAYYYSAPTNFTAPKSLDDIDPEILKTYEKLGTRCASARRCSGSRRSRALTMKKTGPAQSRAVDAVFDSVSVARPSRRAQEGRRDLHAISEALREHPDLVKQYLARSCGQRQFFATLNAAVFSDGSFVYVPRLAARWSFRPYFRINERNTVSSSAR